MEKRYFTYIMSNSSKTLYVGITNDLERRVWQHRQRSRNTFTGRYNVTMLVYLEEFADPATSISREKQLKGWTRRRKLELIATMNPDWIDLAADWFR